MRVSKCGMYRWGASVVAGALVLLAAPTASATLAADRTSQRSTVYKVKVDPRLFGVHDAYLNSLSRPGTGSIRLWDTGTTWPQVQPTATSFNFTRLDQIVADAWANHTEVTLVTAMTPSWALADPSQAGTTQPPSVAAYQAYVTAVMQHFENYQGSGLPGIANYQVWNEANVTTFWSGTTQQMAQLVKAAYDARNSVDPSIRIIAPALVTRLSYQQKWIKRFYAETVDGQPVWKYVDAISLNLYPLDTYPSADGTRPGTPEDSIALLNQVRALLTADAVPSSIPIWDTEINYGMHAGAQGGTSATPIPDALQVAYVMRTFLLNAAQGVKRVNWYAYDMGNLPADKGGTPLGNTLLTDPDNRSLGTLTPAGLAFQRVQGWLAGTMVGTLVNRPCTRDKSGTYTCVITYASSTGRVYWNPYTTAKVLLVKSARKKIDEYGVETAVTGGTKLKVGYRPVLVKSRS